MDTTKAKHNHKQYNQGNLLFLRPEQDTMVKKYHFVGIGGCGMSGLAQVLAQLGERVSGTDMQDSSVLQQLQQRGITIQVGHNASAVPKDVDCVVISAAVPDDNPELVCARQQGVRVCKYAQMLGEVSRRVKTLAVTGTHGKSTTSGWLAHVLQHAGLEPSFVVGAEVDQLGGGSGAGRGEYMVVEACEYDRSFHYLRPKAAAILNIEADHLDYYRDLDEIIEAFATFARLVDKNGLLVLNADDENILRIFRGTSGVKDKSPLETRCQWLSLQGRGDWQAENVSMERGQGCFDLTYQGQKLGRVKLALAGRHNVANALAVAALAREAKLSAEQICAGLESYRGAGRRMSFKGEYQGVVMLDDYAHHPTEIRATLEAIRARYCNPQGPGRLWCVFQPHQHSRTRFFLDEFALSFRAADIILLPDIYFVRESEQLRREVTALQLAEKISANGGQARYLADFTRIVDELASQVRPGDVVVSMGAGDVWKVIDELICRLGRDS